MVNKYESLTKYIDVFSDEDNADNSEIEFINDIMKFVDDNPDMELNNYYSILEENRLRWDKRSMENADVTDASEELVMALIVGAFRAADKSDASIFSVFNMATIIKWLDRLDEIDK